MTNRRALLLGGLAGAAFSALWFAASLCYGVRGTSESALIAAIVFATLAPLFDRFALKYGGDPGPRVLWSSIAWTTPVVGAVCLLERGRPAVAFFSAIAAGLVVIGRRTGFRSVTVRNLVPWLALGGLFVEIGHAFAKSEAAHGAVPTALPVLGIVGLTIAVHGLLARGNALAKYCGLDGKWLHAQMSADGTVTFGDLPPMHAPEGIQHVAGPVLIQLSTEKAATFRLTGAPAILRIVQGMDVDMDGRRIILDEGAKAYATAIALLVITALYTS